MSGTYAVDDYATVYLSTDLAADAAEIIADKIPTFDGWMTTEHFSEVALDPGQNYYLLVHARNYYRGPAMFVGDFTINGDGFTFLNGTHSLLTNTIDWTVNEVGFDAPGATPVSSGTNTGWYMLRTPFPGISADAEMIWPYDADFTTGYNGSAYFVTQVVAVPEPAPAAMFVAGLGMFAELVRRRRRRR